ncbi:MAG TPA: DNA methyltransferase, partial [Anaerovoracaceae bacterium]|nr:DNA methyltransferase [Anaerovoracaceae bacterium]
MANIKETIFEVEKLNPELARQIQKYVKEHSYGLVFEHNLPEAVRLHKKVPAVGDIVNILPPRGEDENNENTVPWVVKSIDNSVASLEHDGETKNVSIEDVVTLVSYRDVIYPGLKEIDRIEGGNPEDPYHMVINAENYHALEALVYAYAGKVDCIYIDPPYNSGAKDWKYNNNYVAAEDQYRHSKWLAFMERRLKLAKQLLNPQDSALIVTIDEKEYLRLGMLLEQMFPESRIQMISSIISRKSSSRSDEFARNNEYVFFVRFGNCKIIPLKETNYINEGAEIHWQTLRRSNATNIRDEQHPNQFYPIYVDVKTNKIVKVGDSLPMSIPVASIPKLDGCEMVFPIRDDGAEMMWGISREKFVGYLEMGYVRATKHTPNKPQKYVIQYLMKGTIKEIDSGSIEIEGINDQGFMTGKYKSVKKVLQDTQWSIDSHDARDYGTYVIQSFMPDRNFPYPKSVYAVEDCLRLVVAEKPKALIVDFFAGSGTTANAVMLLNHLDNGHRRSISITNNEVGDKEEALLLKNGLRPSDFEWEKYGIANYITWPRIKSTITGINTTGEPITGNYKFTEEFPMSDGFKANALLFELTYESAWPIRLDRAFDAIAPILWMQAGCQGPIIKRIGKSYLTTDFYGVLFDYNQASKFVEKVKSTQSIKTAFVVTDDQRRYSN